MRAFGRTSTGNQGVNRTLPHPSSRPSRSLSVRSTPSRNEPSDGVSASDRRISPSSISRRNVVLIGTSLSALSTLSPSGRAALAAELSTADPESLGKMLGLEEKVSEFTLSNGLRFVVLARPRAPVVSCYTFADVGAFEEVDGQTGLAHLLEHLAFKGSTSIGAKDFKREKPMLDSLDEVFYALREAREGGRTSEATRLQEKMNELIEQAEKYVIPNAFGNLMENQGAVGLNAQTSQDETIYYASLPRNKLELWFALESERFANPVFRQLYKEKEVVLNERRLRIDLPPLGKYQEAFALRALPNNYRRPVIGYEADIAALGRREVDHFFRTHYGPSKLVIGIVGDVDPEQVRALAEKYFGPWQMAPSELPPPPALPEGSGRSTAEVLARLLEGKAGGESEPGLLRWESPAGPLFMDAFQRPPSSDSDSLLIEFLVDILGGGRTARLYSNLVLTGKALNTSVLPSYPGEKRANLFLTYGTPGPALGADPARLALAFRSECEALALPGNIKARELQRVKKAARASLLEGLLSNTSMASFLCEYTTRRGSWKGLLTDLDRIDGISERELARVAADLFRAENRFSGIVSKPRGIRSELVFE